MKARINKSIVVAASAAFFFVFVPEVGAHDTAPPPAVKAGICAVFKEYCGEAIRVSWCESRWKTWAKNGQYLGLFQMGENERKTYGHGKTIIAQARAAHEYFVDRDHTWDRWECRYAA